MTLKQKQTTDKMFQKYSDELDKLEMILSNFNLQHLNNNEIKELFGFIPHIWCDDINITKIKSEIFVTYTVYKSEEDFQNNTIQEITLPLPAIEKYIKNN